MQFSPVVIKQKFFLERVRITKWSKCLSEVAFSIDEKFYLYPTIIQNIFNIFN